MQLLVPFLFLFCSAHTHTRTHTLQVCLFCSAGYHMFNCQSEMVHKRWFSLDLMGVSVGLIGCYFPGAYYAFHCHLVREGGWVGLGWGWVERGDVCVCVCATSVRTTMDEST